MLHFGIGLPWPGLNVPIDDCTHLYFLYFFHLICRLDALFLHFSILSTFSLLDGICRLPAVTGPCKAYFPRWYFDNQEGQCKPFIYGGCGGNSNRFSSQEDCEKQCQRKPKGTAILLMIGFALNTH